jgi:hypothetical protein
MFGRLKNWLSGRRTRNKSLERFICFLRLSQLCTEQQLGDLVSKFEGETGDIANGDAVAQFCSFLVDTNAVSAWQCDKLKAGKWKGFYFDYYVLLEQVGKDHEFAYYKARDIRDGTIVRLVVTPVNPGRGLKNEYRVEPYSQK